MLYANYCHIFQQSQTKADNAIALAVAVAVSTIQAVIHLRKNVTCKSLDSFLRALLYCLKSLINI